MSPAHFTPSHLSPWSTKYAAPARIMTAIPISHVLFMPDSIANGYFGPVKVVVEFRHIAGSSNGRTAAFEAVNLGSIPSPPAERISLARLPIGQQPLKP